ncbi:hypothetical protein MPSEU_000452800 [Mayamaea pseudoterrestris]|nr:hypothetical protein MPSEU_000452800 [Mayamaea pseudoterrestris]
MVLGKAKMSNGYFNRRMSRIRQPLLFRRLLVLTFVASFQQLSHAFMRQGLPAARTFMSNRVLQSVDPAFANEGNDTIVTREMFMRDLLEDPKVKRKSKGGYKVLDNRDSLPYQVQVNTPDPYTHPDVKRKNAKKLRKRLDSVEEGIASSLFTSTGKNGGSDDMTLLGEYNLDKLTTTGDLIEIGDMEYRVVRHKCQYRYAGGKRFVMVRKILQVTEVGRLQTEEYLKRQWKQSGDNDNLPVLE